MAPWMRRPSAGRRVAPTPAFGHADQSKKTSSTRTSDHGKHRSRSASSSRNVSTDDKGYNGQTITYRVFNGRGLAPGVKSRLEQKIGNEDAKSKQSRGSKTTVEGTIDSIPTRDESSSSDVDKIKKVGETTKPSSPKTSTPAAFVDQHNRHTYSQRSSHSSREGNTSSSRPKSAGPSYTRPTISATYQRPWQKDPSRGRPSSASAARAVPETNPILKATEQVRAQAAEKQRANSAERSRPHASSDRPRPQSAGASRAYATESNSRPEVKPISNANGVKCYPLAAHLQNTIKQSSLTKSSSTQGATHQTPIQKPITKIQTTTTTSNVPTSTTTKVPTPTNAEKAKTTSATPSGDEKVSERARLEQLLCSSRPKDRSTTDFYSFGDIVGTGSFAKVRLATHKLTGQKVAIKTYEKNKIKDAHALKRITQEIKLMERLDHPLISRFFEAIESARRIHIVMELIGEGNLCSYIKEKKTLGEDEARKIFSQLCSAVEYLHNQHIIHRDIKLENVLFDSQRNIKLIDFGFSVQCKEPKTLKVFCGTPSYMAPEIVRRSEYLGKPVDMWSLGVVLYAMLSGCFPFSAKTYPDLYKKVLKGNFKIPETFSPVIKHLITNLLCSDANRRMKISGAKSHPWLSKYNEIKLKYTPTANFTVSQDAKEDLYREAITRMSGLGVDETVLIHDVTAKRRNSLTTCYYLLTSAMSLRNKPGGI